MGRGVGWSGEALAPHAATLIVSQAARTNAKIAGRYEPQILREIHLSTFIAPPVNHRGGCAIRPGK
jgi:hypothetical protein